MNIRNPLIDDSPVISSGEIRAIEDNELPELVYISNPNYSAINNNYTQQIHIHDNAHFVFEPDYELTGAELKEILIEHNLLKDKYDEMNKEFNEMKKLILKLNTQLNGSIQRKIFEQKHKI